MNGRPLEREGQYAALLRETPKGELRSNMHADGKAKKTAIGESALRLAELVRPKLVEDGMFMVGLDTGRAGNDISLRQSDGPRVS